MKIVAFAGSNSKKSINLQLVKYTVKQFEDCEVKVLDLNDFEVPIYSIDRENETGVPEKIKTFVSKIDNADVLVVSLAEHNGAYTVAFKNLLDWSSRHSINFFADKPMLLMGTSPGGYGAKNVLGLAEKRLPKFNANIKAVFSLPKFGENFDAEKGILDEELKIEHREAVEKVIL